MKKLWYMLIIFASCIGINSVNALNCLYHQEGFDIDLEVVFSGNSSVAQIRGVKINDNSILEDITNENDYATTFDFKVVADPNFRLQHLWNYNPWFQSSVTMEDVIIMPRDTKFTISKTGSKNVKIESNSCPTDVVLYLYRENTTNYTASFEPIERTNQSYLPLTLVEELKCDYSVEPLGLNFTINFGRYNTGKANIISATSDQSIMAINGTLMVSGDRYIFTTKKVVTFPEKYMSYNDTYTLNKGVNIGLVKTSDGTFNLSSGKCPNVGLKFIQKELGYITVSPEPVPVNGEYIRTKNMENPDSGWGNGLSCKYINNNSGYSQYNNNPLKCSNKSSINTVVDSFIRNVSGIVTTADHDDVYDYYVSNCCTNLATDICDSVSIVNKCENYNDSPADYFDKGALYDEDEYINKCIVNNSKYKDNTLSDATGNYCSVYCYESIQTYGFYNAGSTPVVAGRYIDFSRYYNNALGFVEGSRTCYTVVNQSRIKSNIEDRNRAIVDAYLNYLLEEAKATRIASTTGYGEYSNESWIHCPCKYSASTSKEYSFSCCTSAGYNDYGKTCEIKEIATRVPKVVKDEETGKDKTVMGDWKFDSRTDGCKDYTSNRYDLVCGTPTVNETTNVKTTTTTCKVLEATCNKSETSSYEWYDYGTVNVSVNDNGTYRNASWSYSRCANKSAPTADASSAYSNYQTIKRNAENFISETLYACYNLNSNNLYTLSPNLSISYYDGNKYSYAGTLKGNEMGKSTPSEVTYDDGESYNYETLKLNDCGSGKCTKTGASFPLHKSSKVSKTVKLYYTLDSDDNSYKLIKKGNGVALKSSYESNTIPMNMSYLPISFNANSNNYLKINYSQLGHRSSTSSVTQVDKYLSDIYNNYGEWSCKFNLDYELVTDSGLNVIFRTIDLKNPFPGQSDNQRASGANWCDYYGNGTCGLLSGIVESVITSKQDIYEREPMYSFTLTPTIITQIRGYNKNNSYDDFNLSCDANGERCMSNFLHTLIGDNTGDVGDTKASGTCVASSIEEGRKKYYTCQPK